MNEIEKIREKIDRLDRKIVDFLNKRVRLAIQLRDLKKKKNLSIFDPSRENIILSEIKKLASPPLKGEDLERIYREIISVTRNLEEKQIVWYLGPEGSFSHKASLDFFGSSSLHQPLPSITEIFYRVEKDKKTYGVVPVENSMQGTVGETLDCFVETNLKIVGEIYEYISLCLLSREKNYNNIRTIYSHPQALAQCRIWIKQNMKWAKTIEVETTSKAAILASSRKKSAAVGSEFAAEIYKLNILAKDIQDRKNNYTRFLIIGNELIDENLKGKLKTSILFGLSHKPGTLYSALKSFAEEKINLMKIESRPMKDSPWEYIFFVDFEGGIKDRKVKRAMETLTQSTTFLKILGTYLAGRK